MKLKILLSIFLLISLSGFGQNKFEKNKENKPIVLFVCEHGAARSAIAAAYFNKLTKNENLNYIAIFRGTEPDTVLTPATIKGLTKDNFDITGWKPKLVSNRDIRDAYRIIVFDCKLLVVDTTKFSFERWDGIPPISRDYEVTRNQIVEKVTKLIAELPKTRRTKKK